MSDKRLILAVDTNFIPASISGDGFTPLSEPNILDIFDDADTWFGPRDTLETLDTYRQVIPYIICTHKGAVVAYTRGKKGGEGRLHSKVSIGLGGHVDLPDAKWDEDGRFSFENTILMGAVRELQEELGLEAVPPIRLAGLIQLSGTEVDRVHIGVVGVVELETIDSIAPNAAEGLEEVRLELPAELLAEQDRLENWTKVLLPHLNELVANASLMGLGD